MDGVLLSYHGTVSRSEDLPAFVRNIRRGRDAPAEVVAELRRRFERIGGSPLRSISEAQAMALERRLGVAVRAAARLWHPYPSEVVPELAALGVTRLLSLPLAPQSVHVYHPPVEAAAAERGIEVVRAPGWGTEPALIAAFAAAIEAAAASLLAPREAIAVALTAHSLPVRAIAAGDPYERDVRAMAAGVTDAIAMRGFCRDTVRLAFQSQGMGDSGDWLGPDLESTFIELIRARPACSLVCASIGFVAEHVETLYDIEIEARALASRLGFGGFARMAALGDRAGLVDALEAVARRELKI